jgi:hypothetical protein
LASGKSITDALVYGSSLASLCIEGFGTNRLREVSESVIMERITFLKTTLNS